MKCCIARCQFIPAATRVSCHTGTYKQPDILAPFGIPASKRKMQTQLLMRSCKQNTTSDLFFNQVLIPTSRQDKPLSTVCQEIYFTHSLPTYGSEFPALLAKAFPFLHLSYFYMQYLLDTCIGLCPACHLVTCIAERSNEVSTVCATMVTATC